MEHDPFLALLLITALALLVPIAASRFRRVSVPIVVGEILAGILIGRSGLNLVEPSPILTFLGEFGFAYLMFLSGLEVNFELLMTGARSRISRWKRPLPLAFLMLAGTVGLALLFALALAQIELIQNPLLMGLILSTTSLGVVVPVLKERRLLGSTFGQYVLIAASIADFITLILLTVVIAIRSRGLTLDLLLIPLLLLIFLLAVRLTRRVSGLRFLRGILMEVSSATSQIRVRGAFALLVAWVVLAEAFGVEVILGAFLAGAIAGLLGDEDEGGAKEKLDAIGYGFFIPIFFIMVGVEFNLGAILESPRALLLIPLFVLIAYLVKTLPALLLRVAVGWRETFAGGILLSSRLSLIIAAASIALSLGLISEAIDAAIILVAVTSVTASPLLFNRIFPPSAVERRKGIIVIGQDQLAEFLVERLMPTGEAITVVCPDQSRIEAFHQLQVHLVTGCASLEESLRQAGAMQARALIDLTSSVEETMQVTSLSREVFQIPLVISRISDVELIPQLQSLGVKVVQPALATAMAVEGALRYPTIFDLLIEGASADVDVTEVLVRNRSLDGQALRKIRLPGDTLILSLLRDENVMLPHGDMKLQVGDRVGLIGSPGALERSVALLEGP